MVKTPKPKPRKKPNSIAIKLLVIEHIIAKVKMVFRYKDKNTFMLLNSTSYNETLDTYNALLSGAK